MEPLLKVIRLSARAVPANRLAMGVAGVAATAALVLGLIRDLRLAVFGMVVVFVFMSILLVLGWARSGNAQHKLLIDTFLWATLASFIAAIVLLFSAFAFEWPPHAARFLFAAGPGVSIAPENTEAGSLVRAIDAEASPDSAIDAYCVRHALEAAFCTRSVSGAEMVGKHALIYATGSDGYVAFVDADANAVALEDTAYEGRAAWGLQALKVVRNPHASPPYLVFVRRTTITGTGTYGESINIYTIDDGVPLLSLTKPYSEVNSGWGAFAHATVEFVTRNDVVVRNGISHIQTTGVVRVENDRSIERPLPREVYVWNDVSRQFVQVEGRFASQYALMTSIYSDFADTTGDWFTAPPSFENRATEFSEEEW